MILNRDDEEIVCCWLQGTQQMNELRQDMFQAGVREKAPVEGNYDHNILYYVMTHWPGQAPTSWKRLMYAALAHGTKVVDLYEMHSTFFTTENSIGEYPQSANGPYETVQDTLFEYGQFDDIIQGSPSQSAPAGDVALYFSTADDCWSAIAWPGDRQPGQVYKAAKRALYIALRHRHLKVDVLNEDDVVSGGRLAQYDTLYVADPHVSSAATKAIGMWVAEHAGTLYATASAGLLDESNAANPPMRTLLGLTAFATPPMMKAQFATPPVGMLKRDLPTSAALDSVTIISASEGHVAVATFGALVRPGNFTPTPAFPNITAANITVLAHFSDGSPAGISHTVGLGRAVFLGWLPSLSYFKPALPSKPIDICPRDGPDGCFCHFVPSDFDVTAMDVLDLPPLGVAPGGARHHRVGSASAPLVEVGVVSSSAGGVVLLINWDMTAVGNDTLTVSVASAALSSKITTAVRASDGQKVPFKDAAGQLTFSLPGTLVVADAIVLR